MRILQLKNITKRFEDYVTIDNLSIDINKGEIYGLVGPYGAGKTTLLGIMAGLIKPDRGEVFFREQNAALVNKEMSYGIGFVPQEIAVYDEFSVYENIKFFASLYGLKGKELNSAVNQTISLLELEDYSKKTPVMLTVGFKRLLNIACSICHKPTLLILDEPTVGIDTQTRNFILQIIRTLNDTGITIVYTSHYIDEIESLCSKIGIIDHGKIIAQGSSEELKSIITDTTTIIIKSSSVDGLDERKLKKINGVIDVQVDMSGCSIKIISSKDVNNLDKIILFFTNNNISIKNIESTVPDLEMVFLTLTGRRLMG
ncbi:MAG TPA: ABC transporter ATP-binding protein [Petrotogaceae bacterium]|nr:ABC transporter ATP-binding protein [Petrotogaceae bacterium]HQO12218.1 ABC transporter ATP-binding protein [Petrotogaceae bacterium]HQP57573.1 ABC transporter ATP-binding protein [Petrotogaceae bacterium]